MSNKIRDRVFWLGLLLVFMTIILDIISGVNSSSYRCIMAATGAAIILYSVWYKREWYVIGALSLVIFGNLISALEQFEIITAELKWYRVAIIFLAVGVSLINIRSKIKHKQNRLKEEGDCLDAKDCS